MRPSVFVCLVFYGVVGLCAAFAQTAGDAPSELSTLMDEPGPPLAKEAVGAEANLPLVQLRDFGGDIPTGELSRLAQQPLPDAMVQTRSARDAHIYRMASPAVVLIATKNGFGSGSLIGPFGEVVTNWHVVSRYAEVGVVFKPSAEGQVPGKDDILTGFVTKYDEVADLALVKVANAPAAASFLRLGASSDISIGLDVHAIGHPTGEAWTYTKGIISQFRPGYEWQAEHGIKHKADIIQTQTPINPGNSGGPLITDSGALIGINSFKAEGEGLSFAVSVDDVKRFLTRTGNRAAEAQAAPPAKPKCEPKELSRWRKKENDGTIVGYDLTCSKRLDAELVYYDDTSLPILLRVDRNHDGRTDTLFFDLKRKDKWDLSWWDENFEGHWTLVGYHDDGSTKPSRFESYEAYRKRLAKRCVLRVLGTCLG